jgi:hypothetical protein
MIQDVILMLLEEFCLFKISELSTNKKVQELEFGYNLYYENIYFSLCIFVLSSCEEKLINLAAC